MYEILIIDDQESIIDMLKRRLQKYGYLLNTCLNVKDAKAVLNSKKIDLLLIDYMMPEISGFDFFLTFENKQDIPVIMMTAHPTINLVTEFIKHGGADFIEKPIDVDILHMKLQRSIHNNKILINERSHRLAAETALQNSFDALKQKSIQLELANSQLESFAGVVAHDLRSPLSGQKILLNYLVKKTAVLPDALSVDLNNKLIMLKDNIDEMLILVNVLLEFSKLQDESFTMQKVDAHKIINEILNLNQSNKNLELHNEVTHEVEAEPTLLKQIFANLIQNAIKYSSNKEKQVVKIQSEKKDGKVIFSVADNGIGFKMEHVNKLFSMFSRLDTKENYEGFGLGLAIVKNIVNRHNGKIWVESTEGKGSVFYFSLPE